MREMIGRVLGNRYEILEKIGEGGMAYVYKAKCRLLNRFVAVKVLRDELANDSDFVTKFDQESQAAASLSHPNIVNIYDVGKDNNTRYIVMELIKGLTLKKYIQKHKGFIPNEEIVEIAKQIALGLDHAHSNRIIHRDIKPHNILINEEGIVKVADFGIARAVSSSTIVSSREALGSVHYASPEQSRGGFVDKKSDIYSLGILIYELSTKKLPFEGEQPVSIAIQHMEDNVILPSKINHDIKATLESVIIKAIQKDPNERYKNVRELIDDLDKISKNPNLDIPFYIISKDGTGKMLPNLDVKNIKKSNNKAKKSGKINKFRFALVIIGALLLSSLIVAGIFMHSILERINPKIVPMPNIVGMEYVKAADTLKELGLKINVRDHEFNPDVKKDCIIKQFEAENSSLKEGFTVDVIVSNGPEIVKIPNLIQKDLSEARIILDNKELQVGEIKYTYNDLPSGMVVEQSPVAGSDSKKGIKVDLLVSQGQPIETVIMPNLVGKNINQAKNILSKNNLFLGDIKYNDSASYPKGIIMIQSIKKGKEIKEKSTVDIVISKGNPDGTANKNDTPTDPNADQTNQPPPSGLVEKTYIIPLSFATQTEVVKVEMIQNGVSTIIYEKEHNRDEKDARVVITAKGQATINIYFGTLKIKSMDVDFN